MKDKLIPKQKITSIYIVLTLLWTIVIFSFSLQPGSTSSELSSGIGTWLVETFLPWCSEKLKTIPQEQMEFCHFLLRKCGHFTEFLILGVFSILTLFQSKIQHKKTVGMLYCVLAASVDETIQLFISGRSGQISDVLLDSIGALTGIFLVIKWKREKVKL